MAYMFRYCSIIDNNTFDDFNISYEIELCFNNNQWMYFQLISVGGRMCPDIFQLNDVCTIPGKKTAFHCLIYSDTDTYPMYWEYEPDADTGKSRIAQNEQVVEGLRHKYEADIFNVNRTHSCAQLAINVDADDPDKAYYMCAFGHEQLWAQLRLSSEW